MAFWKNLWQKVWGKTKEEARDLWDWAKKTGLPWWKSAMKDTAQVLWETYQKQILGIVLDIAKKILSGDLTKDKTVLAHVFVDAFKKMLDNDGDGSISWDDIPDGVISFLQELAVRLFKSLGDNDQSRVEALSGLLRED